MSELEVMRDDRRGFDLPPFWDSRPVTWHGWEYPAGAFICPRPAPSCCRACGAPDAQVHNRGSRRVVEGGSRWLPTLWAFRCVKCRTDTVWETGTNEYWTLDESDYGPDGSTAP